MDPAEHCLQHGIGKFDLRIPVSKSLAIFAFFNAADQLDRLAQQVSLPDGGVLGFWLIALLFVYIGIVRIVKNVIVRACFVAKEFVENDFLVLDVVYIAGTQLALDLIM